MGMTLRTDDGLEISIERIRVVEILAGEVVLITLAGSEAQAGLVAVEDEIKILFREKKPMVTEERRESRAQRGKG